MRLIIGLLLAATLVQGGGFEDEVNPRAAGSPLKIVYRPWYCAECVKEGRIEGPKDRVLEMMRLPTDKLAKHCGIKKRWRAIETPNFKIFCNLRSAKVRPTDTRFGRADMSRLKTIFPRINPKAATILLTPHERAHLYHLRVERIYSHFAALTGNKKKWLGMHAPYELYLFDRYDEHHAFMDRFVGRRNDRAGVQHHVRTEPNFMMYTTAESLVPGGDLGFNNHVIHNVAHILVDGYGNYYRETWAWLEEGLAHYYERRESLAHNTFCWAEGKRPSLFLKPRWKPTILSLVRREKDTMLGQWCEKIQPGELTGVEQGLSWSIVEWMIRTDPIRFARLVEKCQDFKNKPTSAECIEFAFGVPPSTVHDRWRQYVLAEYSKR